MYSDSVVCDCCKRAINPGQVFVRVHVLRTEPAHESPLDALDRPSQVATCLRCHLPRNEENESTVCVEKPGDVSSAQREHRWSDEECRPRGRRGRRGGDTVEYCMPCFGEHAQVHVQKLARTATVE